MYGDVKAFKSCPADVLVRGRSCGRVSGVASAVKWTGRPLPLGGKGPLPDDQPYQDAQGSWHRGSKIAFYCLTNAALGRFRST
jgi:hypothetical protein